MRMPPVVARVTYTRALAVDGILSGSQLMARRATSPLLDALKANGHDSCRAVFAQNERDFAAQA